MSKKVYIALTALLALGISIFGSMAMAADTGTVAATVTVQNISVTVSTGSVTYGTIAASGTKDTTSTGTNESQTATNNGNIAENFNITGANTTGCVWTLAATQGSNQYFHKFCNNGTCDATPSWTALTASYQTLGTGIAVSGTKEFDLQIGVPSSSSCYTEATATVTIQAVAGS